MASQTQQLENPTPPGLGYPTETYERRHFNENNGALTVYFKKLSFVLGSLFGPRGGRFMNTPHGAFQDSTDQVTPQTMVKMWISGFAKMGQILPIQTADFTW
jgi:hypothetical protein